ncbi:MSHA biogenesis protein MshK [Paucimonas lemoignei]|uniref:MSHA biogenesis protein MshK n=1 Tax=Paucimonas lemoignei TaxID=29443 RepID=A0A4R3I239_PAULE|nr:MSHA biogenesis protein MshK [Paucimonas lemoignei]TCS39083.1 MSHA biogenesis protein MshK [Paucimonas lemoignei]
MAQSVNSVMRRVMFHCGCLLMLAGSGQVLAQTHLPDPTRPPVSLHAGAAAEASGSGAPVLQSVLISPKRKVAVISGETVQVGDRIGDARVTKISEGEVVLSRDGKPQSLKLFPGIEKHRTKSGAEARETGRRQ